MVDVHTPKKRSYNMSRIRSSNTKPELKLKKDFVKRGFVYQPNEYGKPDFINYAKNIVIFVDGCFWHKCPQCFKMPMSNTQFWRDKLEKNVWRDVEVTLNYRNSGWKVIRIWEHELKTRKFINPGV